MKISVEHIENTCPESEIYNTELALDGKHILELGCGPADLTRAIATEGQDRQITALEVDKIQHAKNEKITDLPNVCFKLAGAQAIPEADNTFDIVFMFKSLHHVPLDLMEKGFAEIHRVLKPGGYAYISEPIFAGDFNEILRLFNDEQEVRAAAFEATKAAVNSGLFQLCKQIFFNTPIAFENFEDFEKKVLQATHTEFNVSPELHARIKEKFSQYAGKDGARFNMPMRVDLLQKPANNTTS